MTLQVFPESITRSFPIVTDEGFKTLVSEFEGGNEQAQMILRFPRRSVRIPYGKISDTDWPTLHNFFRKRRGAWEPFWYFAVKSRSLVDEYVGQGGPFYVDGAVADDGGVQTDESIYAVESTANDMTLLPATPAQNDAYYFGKKVIFDKLTVTIGTQGAGTWTIVWEYWNGTTWGSLSGVTDGTAGFKAAAGDHDVTFTIPSGWVDCEVKNRNLYWIRARVSAYTSKTTQPKGSYAKVNTKTYDLPSKNTVNDSSLIAYVNDVVTSKTFISAGGGGGADRIAFSGYQAAGALITADFTGKLRIRVVCSDSLSDNWFRQWHSKMEFSLRETTR